MHTPLLILGALLAAVPAAGPRAVAGAGVDVLGEARAALEEGRWSAARGQLVGVLEETTEAELGTAALAEVRGLLLRCAFEERFAELEAQDVFGEALEEWSPSSGRIALQYRRLINARPPPGAPELPPEGSGVYLPGFVESERGVLLPLELGAPYSVVVHGTLPRGEAGEGDEGAPALRIDAPAFEEAAGDGYGLRLDPDGGSEAPVRLVRFTAEDEEPLEESDEPLLRPGRSYSVELRVGRIRLTLNEDGERVLRAKKPRDRYGRIELGAARGVRSVRIEAVVAGAELGGLFEAHRERLWGSFERLHELAVGPAWFQAWCRRGRLTAGLVAPPELAREQALQELDALAAADAWEAALAFLDGLPPGTLDAHEGELQRARLCEGAGRIEDAIPALRRAVETARDAREARSLSGRLRVHLQRVEMRLGDEDVEPAERLRYLRGLDETVLGGFATAWRAHALEIGVEDYAASLASLDRAVLLRAEYPEAHRGRGNVLVRLGRLCEAIAAYGRCLELAPQKSAAHVSLVECWIHRGRHAEAAAALERAREAGVEPGELEDVRARLERARYTPPLDGLAVAGDGRFRVAAPDEARARAVLEALADAHAVAEDRVRRLPRTECSREPARVYVFDQASAFEECGRHVFPDGMVSSSATYEHRLGVLLMHWRGEDSLRTAHHEGIHGYVGALAHDAPPWFHEGLACYLEGFRRRGGRSVPPAERSFRVRVLADRSGPWLSLEELFALDHDAFYADKNLHYAYSYALVHYLAEGGAEPRALLEWLLDELAAGVSHGEVGRRLLAHPDAADLSARVREHFERVLRR